MLLIRPVNLTDLQSIERLAVISGGSMTTLPANRDHLSDMISCTQRSLKKTVEDFSDESYHFALIDTATETLIGISGIDASVGLDSPFYSYRIEEVVHASGELQIHNRIPALHLCQDYTGAARLCTLFLDAPYRNDTNLNLLSRARMLFIAQNSQRFANRLIAELQGVADESGQSPFWECLGRHFFNMDFTKANYLTGINAKGFIADLMPHYPVYVPLLTPEAQEALGQCRPDLTPIQNLLEKEGFGYKGYVDIFDAGPTIECRTQDALSVSQSKLLTIECKESPVSGELHLISNTQLSDFRCVLAPINPEQPEIEPPIAEALNISSGEPIRVIPLNLDMGDQTS